MTVLCSLDIEKYTCVSDEIITDEVIITDERLSHVKEKHPEIAEVCTDYLALAIEDPDYIIQSNKPHSALILKEIHYNEIRLKIILRLITSTDSVEWKNSVITFHKTSEKEWRRLIKNKKVLYSKRNE